MRDRFRQNSKFSLTLLYGAQRGARSPPIGESMKLKQCPFCFEDKDLEVIQIEDPENGTSDYRVRCMFCDGMGGMASTEESAIQIWNIREPHNL